VVIPPARLTAKPCYQDPPLSEARDPSDVGACASRRSTAKPKQRARQQRPLSGRRSARLERRAS